MIRAYKILVPLLAAATLSSCSFLEEKQPTGLQDVYSTPEMLESAINGIIGSCYGSPGYLGEAHEYFAYASGLWNYTPTVSSKIKNYMYIGPVFHFTHYSTVAKNGNFYLSLYKGINYCNVLLDNLKDSPVEQEYKDEIAAEAKFYRAVFYLTAVQIWGDLPLRTGPVTNANAAGIPRSPYYEVYAQIVADLKDAESGMRSPQRVREATPGSTRPNKFAATAFLAKTYLTIGSLLRHSSDNFWRTDKPERLPDFSKVGVSSAEDAYSLALGYAEQLIPESGHHNPECPYRLLDNYSDLFAFEKEDPSASGKKYSSFDHPEQIFVLPITETSNRSLIAQRTLPRHPVGTSCTDPSKGDTNCGRYRPSRFLFYHWCKDNGPVDGSLSTEATYLGCQDPRMGISLIYGNYLDISTGNSTSIYPNVIKCSNGANEVVYPYLRKYASPSYNFNNGDADYYFMRLAEVYYIAAEAAAELGDWGSSGKAWKYVGIVQKRARDSSPTPVSYPSWEGRSFSSADECVTAIFWDKMYELLGEGHEWNETHRRGSQWLADNIAKPLNDFLDLPESQKLVATTWAYPAGFRYSTDPGELRKSLLAALPDEAIMYSTAITYENQNDYYYQ